MMPFAIKSIAYRGNDVDLVIERDGIEYRVSMSRTSFRDYDEAFSVFEEAIGIDIRNKIPEHMTTEFYNRWEQLAEDDLHRVDSRN